MKNYWVLPLLFLSCLFVSCEREREMLDGDWYNQYSKRLFYIGLEGGEISITSRFDMVYSSTRAKYAGAKHVGGVSQNAIMSNEYDASIYPYTITTKYCIIEHVVPKRMDITILPSEQKREIFIRLGGVDENGVTHRTPDDGIWIYQGNPAPASVPEPTE